MNAARGRTFLLAAVALLASCGPAARAGQYLAAGNESALWLVPVDEDAKGFRLLIRPAEASPGGGKWRWADHWQGRPLAAVAVGDRLYLLLDGPRGLGCMSVSAADGDSTTAASLIENQPGAALRPLAVCEARDFPDAPPETVLAVVPLPAESATQPSTHTAPKVLAGHAEKQSTQRVNLAIHLLAGSAWRQIAQWPNVRLSAQAKLLAATIGRTLYVLIAEEGGNRLAAWNGTDWTDVPLDEGMSAAKALGMIVVPGAAGAEDPRARRRLALVLAGPAAQGRLSLRVALYDAPTGRFAVQPVTDPAGAATWSDGEALTATGLAADAAVIWRDAQGLHLGMISPASGRLWKTDVSDVLQKGPAEGGGLQVLSYVGIGVMVAAFLLTFVVRPAMTPKLFFLPPGYRTAHLGRRALAAAIDLLPFGAILYVLAPLPADSRDVWDTEGILSRMMVYLDMARSAYTIIASLGLYGLYGALAEYRLGATLGKKLLRLRVLGDDGRAIDFYAAALRNLWKIVELTISIAFFLTILSMLLNRYRRRMGDLMARTVVVDADSRPRPDAHDESASPPAS